MYDIKTIDNDFRQVEEFLKNSKVTYFGLPTAVDSIMLWWNGETLSRYDSLSKKQLPLSEMTETDRAIWHRYLPDVLREAKRIYKNYPNKAI